MKHLTDSEIGEYLLNLMPLEQEIRTGLHIQECTRCSSRAETLHAATQSLDNATDTMFQLPREIERFELLHRQIIPRVDKDSVISILQKYLGKSTESLQRKLGEIINHLQEPDIQIARLTPLASGGEAVPRSRKLMTPDLPGTLPVSAYLPGNALTITRAAKNTLECRIESIAKHTPTIVSHGRTSGIDIMAFSKTRGSNIYTAQVPAKSSREHYLIYKTTP
jgi:hypothetical protein